MVGPFALTDPSYRFWSRSVGGEVANYGPRQCYDGADNEDSPDGLIDYGSDLECESYLDDSEVPGSSSGGGGGESDEGEEVVDTEGQPEEEIEEVEIEDEVVEEVEETVPEIIDEPADPTPRKPLIVDVGDVVEEVEDAGSNTVDTISGIKQAKEERETIIDSIIEQDVVIEEEVLVEKTEEQERISSILEGIVDTIDEENLARVTAKLDAVVEKEVSRILDEVAAPSSSGGSSSSRIVLKTGGVDKEVTPDTEIVTLLDATLASESQQQAIEDEEDVVYISPSTTPEVSETSILKIIEYGGDVNDELIDDKVFMKGLSGISDRSTRIQDILPPSPIITNLDGLTVGLRILAWTASSNVGDELTYYIVDRIDPDDPDTWDIQKIAEVVVGEDYKAAPLIDLEPYLNLDEGDEIKEVDLLVQNQDGLGEYVKITVDPKLEFEARELHLSRGEIIKVTDPKGTSARRGAHNFSLTDSMKTSVWLAIAHAAENETGKDLTAHPSNRQLTGYYDPGTTVFVTWKSVVLNSVVIADASQGYFEVDVPEDLEEGDHTVLVYAYNEKTSWISNVNSMLFNTW